MGGSRTFNKLSDTLIRNTRPRVRPYKLSDGRGLYLEVCPNGSRLWRLKYRIAGREKRAAFGAYPEVSLAEAREKALAARRLVADGRDPVTVRRVARAATAQQSANTFAAVAEAWIKKNAGRWSVSYAEKVGNILSANLFPRIGGVPLTELTAPMVLTAIHPIELRGAVEQAARALRWTSAVFRFGVIHGHIAQNPLQGVRASEVLQLRASKSHPHLGPSELGDFLRKLHDYPGRPETRLAVRLLLLTFVRTVELRAARWEEFDFEAAEWRIPAARMKMRTEHIVPLAKQTIALLNELREFSSYSEYLFPNHGKHPYMSENTVNKAIALLGYKGRVVGHGFRATASTILNESGHFNVDVIERQLAHKEPNEVRRIYDRAQHLAERRRMMAWWANFLDAVQRGAAVRKFSKKER